MKTTDPDVIDAQPRTAPSARARKVVLEELINLREVLVYVGNDPGSVSRLAPQDAERRQEIDRLLTLAIALVDAEP